MRTFARHCASHRGGEHADLFALELLRGQKAPSTTPRFGVWGPCGKPGLQPNASNLSHGLNGKTNGRWESNCAPGAFRDLPRSRHDCDPSGKVVVGGTHMTRRNNFPCGYEVLEGEDARKSTGAFSGW